MIIDTEKNLHDALYDRVMAGATAEKPTYAGSFEGQLADIYNRIQNREKFKYDVNADPLYQQYKDKFVQKGKLAMRDSMGKAAALTGGYGTSYGQQVGQQTYDAYLQSLTDVIPELYGMAYNRYRDEGDDMLKEYSMAQDLRDTEYGRWRDDLTDYNRQQDLAISQEREDYNRRRDDQAYQQQLYSNLYAMIKATGYVPTDAELAAAGMTREAATAIAAEYQRGVDMDERTMALKELSAYGSSSSGGGGGGGGSYGGGESYGYYPTEVTSGEYERFLRNTMADDLGYMPTAGQVGWNDTSQMLDTLGIQQQTAYTGGARQKTFEEQTGNKGYTGAKTAGQDWNEVRKRLGI